MNQKGYISHNYPLEIIGKKNRQMEQLFAGTRSIIK